jgi:hypothetical protein
MEYDPSAPGSPQEDSDGLQKQRPPAIGLEAQGVVPPSKQQEVGGDVQQTERPIGEPREEVDVATDLFQAGGELLSLRRETMAHKGADDTDAGSGALVHRFPAFRPRPEARPETGISGESTATPEARTASARR